MTKQEANNIEWSSFYRYYIYKDTGKKVSKEIVKKYQYYLADEYTSTTTRN